MQARIILIATGQRAVQVHSSNPGHGHYLYCAGGYVTFLLEWNYLLLLQVDWPIFVETLKRKLISH